MISLKTRVAVLPGLATFTDHTLVAENIDASQINELEPPSCRPFVENIRFLDYTEKSAFGPFLRDFKYLTKKIIGDFTVFL
jgi:hypothetical protein